MIRIRNTIIILGLVIIQSCNSQAVFTLYKFSYFENTPVAALAKAVENEDTVLIKRIAAQKGIDINYRETVYDSNTLLITAISNEKVLSVKALLEAGADVNILNKSNKAAIHETVNYPTSYSNCYKILKLLLQYGANPNHMQYDMEEKNRIVSSPLADAVKDTTCANLLIQHGANIYLKVYDDFIVWTNALFHFGDGIFLIKDLVVNKKVPIPLKLNYPYDGNGKLKKQAITIFEYLNDYPRNSKEASKLKARDEILDYLKKIDYPNHQVYIDTSFNHINPLLEKSE